MPYHCATCREEFATLTRKRLHDCTGAPVEEHDLPEALSEGLPERFLTTEEALGLGGEGIERFFPVLSVEGGTGTLDVAAGYANTDAGHVLLAFDGTDGTWYVVERTEDTAAFEHSERALWHTESSEGVEHTDFALSMVTGRGRNVSPRGRRRSRPRDRNTPRS